MIFCPRNRFLDIVEGRLDSGQMTKMKDISLKGRKDVSGEMVVNKIQDFVWDDVLSEHSQHPNVCWIKSFLLKNNYHTF